MLEKIKIRIEKLFVYGVKTHDISKNRQLAAGSFGIKDKYDNNRICWINVIAIGNADDVMALDSPLYNREYYIKCRPNWKTKQPELYLELINLKDGQFNALTDRSEIYQIGNSSVEVEPNQLSFNESETVKELDKIEKEHNDVETVEWFDIFDDKDNATITAADNKIEEK